MNRCLLFLVLAFANPLPSAYSQEASNLRRVIVANGRISVSAQGIPLRQILDDVRQASTVGFSTFPGAEAELISADIDNVPLDQGLRILLGRFDSIFLYSAHDADRAELTRVWVYRKGQASGLEPTPEEAAANTKGLREKLNDPDRGVRRRVFEALLARPGIEEQDAITTAVLAEPDDSLRASMIESVRSSSLRLPPEFWGSLSNDTSEHVRLLVLDTLEGTAQARDFATLALTDPSPHVRLRAKDILDAIAPESASAPGCEVGCIQK